MSGLGIVYQEKSGNPGFDWNQNGARPRSHNLVSLQGDHIGRLFAYLATFNFRKPKISGILFALVKALYSFLTKKGLGYILRKIF
jgi:hypothetical protein